MRLLTGGDVLVADEFQSAPVSANSLRSALGAARPESEVGRGEGRPVTGANESDRPGLSTREDWGRDVTIS